MAVAMTSRVLACFASFVILGSFGACSSKDQPATDTQPTDPADAGADAGPSAQDSCLVVASAKCDRLERCSPHMLRTTYGSIDNCNAREKLACGAFAQAGFGITGKDLLGCASDVTNQNCTDFVAGALPASCQKPGTLAKSAPCASDLQCASGACGTHGQACGTCTVVSRAGDDCSEAASAGNCGAGLACLSGTCVKLGKVGASCDAARLPCAAGLACANSKCVEPIRNEDTACDPNSSACDVTAGLYCERETKTCKPVTLATLGEACGFLNRVYVACEAGSCVSGTCAAAGAEGTACVADSQCAAPGKCLDKKCQIAGVAPCH